MHTELKAPNEFEINVLNHIALEHSWLHAFIGKLRVFSREFTGCGSYTNFAQSSAFVNIPDEHFSLEVLISMPSIPNGLGATVFVRGGYISFLEIYVYGEETWDGTFSGFKIETNA